VHKAPFDDKKLQATLKKLGVQPIPGIEVVEKIVEVERFVEVPVVVEKVIERDDKASCTGARNSFHVRVYSNWFTVLSIASKCLDVRDGSVQAGTKTAQQHSKGSSPTHGCGKTVWPPIHL